LVRNVHGLATRRLGDTPSYLPAHRAWPVYECLHPYSIRSTNTTEQWHVWSLSRTHMDCQHHLWNYRWEQQTHRLHGQTYKTCYHYYCKQHCNWNVTSSSFGHSITAWWKARQLLTHIPLC